MERVLAQVRQDRRPAALLVHGSAGMGKSSLAAGFVAAHRGSWRVLAARGSEWELGEPYGVVTQLLCAVGERSADDLLTDLDVRLRAVEVGQRLAVVLADVARGQGCIVVLDDAQWADEQSIQALTTASRRLAEPVLLLLLASDDGRQAHAARAAQTLADRVDSHLLLSRFGIAEVRELARRVGVLLSALQAATLAEHCSGNPGLIRQLLGEHDPQYWRTRSVDFATTTAALREVSGALAEVSSDARALAEAAGVVGLRSELTVAAAVAGLDDAVPGFDELFGAGLVSMEGTDGVSTIAFRDAVTRAAIYAATGPLRRRELHERAADLLSSPADRLRHRAAAFPSPDAGFAAELTQCALDQADRGEWAGAAKTMLLAAQMSPTPAEEDERLLRGVEALVGAGDLVQAADFVPEVESRPESALRSSVLGYLAVCRGRSEEAERYLAEAWRRVGDADPDDARALICRHRVLDSLARWDGEDLVLWSERSVELERGGAASAVESIAMTGLGLGMLGDIDRAHELHADALLRTGNSAQTQRLLLGQGWLDLADDRFAGARRALESALPTTRRGGSTRIALWATGWLARAQFAYGNWDAALATMQDGVSLLADTGIDLIRPLVHWTGAQIHALRGQHEAAEAHLHRIEQLPNEYLVMEAPARLARAQVAEVVGDHDAVIAALRPLTRFPVEHSINAPGFWPWQDVYAEALVTTGQLAQADQFLRPHEERARLRGHITAQARLLQVRARWVAAEGDMAAAVETIEPALQLLLDLPHGYELARVRRSYGQLLRRSGHRRQADGVLQLARDTFASLAATVEVNRCDVELRVSSSRPRRDARSLPDLTQQERTVASLVAAGRSNKEVATELYLSVKTVQFHLTRVYAKLAIRSRSELAAKFAELDLDGL